MPARGSDSGGGRAAGPSAPEGYTVRAVVRAVQLLDLLRESSDGGASLQELSKRSGLAKASVYRMLRTLDWAGLVERVPGSERYRLGVRCLEFGRAYLEQVDFRREALPVLDRLRVVYLEKLDSAHAVGIMMSRVGRTAPSYCTALGKALLAALSDDPVTLLDQWAELRRHTANTICDPDALRDELESIRSRGYALDLEEHEPGVRCVAASIPGLPADAAAALSIAGPAHRMPDELLCGRLAEAVVSAAGEVAARLGAVPEVRR